MAKAGQIRVGSMAVARRQTAVCDVGERGVCYEVYGLGDRPGYSFIFASGRYDGFSPDEVDTMLELTGRVAGDVESYRFANVMQLDRDYRAGRFASAFLPGKHGRGERDNRKRAGGS
jgi:hypothetical protein